MLLVIIKINTKLRILPGKTHLLNSVNHAQLVDSKNVLQRIVNHVQTLMSSKLQNKSGMIKVDVSLN